MLLGGLRYLIPVIKEAQSMGVYVITCDYIPENIAHIYSDEYQNVDITDREKVLAIASTCKIDGIMSFAVDPGVLTAAYVAENLGLPTAPLSSVETLQNKALFRKFLEENGFNVPLAKSFSNLQSLFKGIDDFNFPVIIKPVDSAGSKGVKKILKKEEIEDCYKIANSYSQSNTVIVEEFIEAKNFASDSDCFSLNGKFQIVSFSNQYFNSNSENPYTPSAYSWPSVLSNKIKTELKDDLQRLISLLGIKTSIYNIEVREGKDGKPYIMEVSPRGGGNRLSEMIKYSTGIDLINLSIKASLGLEIHSPVAINYNDQIVELILYSNAQGKFDKIEIDPSVEMFLIESDLWVSSGDQVFPFSSANFAIGTMVFKFETYEQVQNIIQNRDNLVNVLVY